MELYIDTATNPQIKLCLREDGKIIATREFVAKYSQAEKLLPAIDDLLLKNDVQLNQIQKVFVSSRGDSFTSLRIGVVTANALAFALGIRVFGVQDKDREDKAFEAIKPRYDHEPNITISKNS